MCITVMSMPGSSSSCQGAAMSSPSMMLFVPTAAPLLCLSTCPRARRYIVRSASSLCSLICCQREPTAGHCAEQVRWTKMIFSVCWRWFAAWMPSGSLYLEDRKNEDDRCLPIDIAARFFCLFAPSHQGTIWRCGGFALYWHRFRERARPAAVASLCISRSALTW